MSQAAAGGSSAESPRYPEEMSWWSPVIQKILARQDLTKEEANEAGGRIFRMVAGRGPDSLLVFTTFFAGLTAKGPSVDELAGIASAMDRTKLFRFDFRASKPIVTAGGTGGDTLKTINVTTPAVIIAASAGAVVAKSAAKAFSSKSGSADFAAALGINVESPKEVVERCVERVGTTVWASAGIYPWMEPILGIRSLSVAPVVFPAMDSLRLVIATALNPFGVERQVRGTSLRNTELIARVLQLTGHSRVLVPLGFGRDEQTRIDEFSNLGKTLVSELGGNGKIETYEVTADDFGARRGDEGEVGAREIHDENARAGLGVIAGRDRSSRRDLILMNAASILYLADEVRDFKDGFEAAANAVDSGESLRRLRDLVRESNGEGRRLESLLQTC